MPELTSQQIEKIERGMDTVILLKTVLLGANGDEGLVGKVNEACVKQDAIEASQEQLATRVTKIEVRSGLIATLISVVAAIASFFGIKSSI